MLVQLVKLTTIWSEKIAIPILHTDTTISMQILLIASTWLHARSKKSSKKNKSRKKFRWALSHWSIQSQFASTSNNLANKMVGLHTLRLQKRGNSWISRKSQLKQLSFVSELNFHELYWKHSKLFHALY